MPSTAAEKSGRELCARLVWLRHDARTDENLALLHKTVVKAVVKTVVRGAPVDENESFRLQRP